MASKDEWTVYEYEEMMFSAMLAQCRDAHNKSFSRIVRNAFTESLLLHTRNLADILLSRSRRDDDITLDELLPGFKSPLVAELSDRYGTGKEKDSPCWTINKMLFHSTKERSEGFDYSGTLETLTPAMLPLVAQVRAERDKPQATAKEPESTPETGSQPAPEPTP